MNQIVDGEPAGWSPGDKSYTMLSKENCHIRILQAKIGRTPKFDNFNDGITGGCRNPAAACRHVFHIPTSLRNAAALPEDVGNIAGALNYQVHISQGALEYCNLIYHTLIGSLKDQPMQSPDLIRKLEDLQNQVEQLSSNVCDFRLSQKDIDQISSKIGIVVSGNVQVPTAEEIASKIKVPTARDITQEIGELSLNEFTKSDLVNRISKFIPVSGVAKDIADKIIIPQIKVPTAAEIASHIQIPSVADLTSKIKIPSAKEIADQIHIPETKIDYNRIASEVVNRICLPEVQSIDICSLAQQIADRIPKCDPAAIAANILIPPLPAFPTAEQIASKIHVDIPTAQEIANEIAKIKPDVLQPVEPSGPDYSKEINQIDKKCDSIIAALQGKVG